MAIRYYKLFDLLNRSDMIKSDLLEIISSKTIAKLGKGENITTDVIDKICEFMHCQPGDIMERVEIEELEDGDIIITKEYLDEVEDVIEYRSKWEQGEDLRLDL